MPDTFDYATIVIQIQQYRYRVTPQFIAYGLVEICFYLGDADQPSFRSKQYRTPFERQLIQSHGAFEARLALDRRNGELGRYVISLEPASNWTLALHWTDKMTGDEYMDAINYSQLANFLLLKDRE